MMILLDPDDTLSRRWLENRERQVMPPRTCFAEQCCAGSEPPRIMLAHCMCSSDHSLRTVALEIAGDLCDPCSSMPVVVDSDQSDSSSRMPPQAPFCSPSGSAFPAKLAANIDALAKVNWIKREIYPKIETQKSSDPNTVDRRSRFGEAYQRIDRCSPLIAIIAGWTILDPTSLPHSQRSQTESIPRRYVCIVQDTSSWL
ncbi:hypothetical protein PHSY_006329 [Pseudozyma hubeiensis SY62]|uniref:Uncharacterized protein n=1 Tax=Pseudozyma hubeiensis (strain SY62) TaxID=1305764 RepID=R9PKV2_PSEHS|nr:hypothetical protein PHSY_006329 [Pseudozyma hubeiensis SY62]GAC98735.1 hypothetical protein PHSY_006329 [Pseudozyma hubeiensis SY62]